MGRLIRSPEFLAEDARNMDLKYIAVLAYQYNNMAHGRTVDLSALNDEDAELMEKISRRPADVRKKLAYAQKSRITVRMIQYLSKHPDAGRYYIGADPATGCAKTDFEFRDGLARRRFSLHNPHIEPFVGYGDDDVFYSAKDNRRRKSAKTMRKFSKQLIKAK